MLCEFCGVWNPKGWARCFNCGEPFESNGDDYDALEEKEDDDMEKELPKFITNPTRRPEFEIEELSKSKIKQLMKQPIIETRIGKSRDGKFMIVKTIITDIKPVLYYEKVLGVK